MGVPLGIVRMGIDMCSGHPAGPTYFPPRPAVMGSPDVFVDGLPAVRVTDVWCPHTNILSVHPGAGISGSPTVFCNGLPLMRMLDAIDCGSIALTGSTTTLAG
jgi:uncharacterized Zn-binding protein involved in type VI secretion